MRPWRKTFVTTLAARPDEHLDRTVAEHTASMGGYRCDGYESRERFFSVHFDAVPRLQHYQAFLAEHLPRNGRTLSIASGRAVNELRLGEQGYDVLCSDLQPVCADATHALFPHYRFWQWNALDDPIPADRFDAVMCLSFVYLLAPPALQRFFGRVAELLKPQGTFVLDSAGSPDRMLANVLHDVVLPLEAYAVGALLNARALVRGSERHVVTRKHHGYRYGDEEFIAAAARHGLALGATSRMDFESEWMRMYLYRYVGVRVPPLRAAMRRLGARIPYVRMFAFQRS